jgi:MoaA/NifB/PqqE/SkfB family radical SAM enzyme
VHNDTWQTDREDLLLLSTSTGLLYRLPQEACRNIKVLFGSVSPELFLERFTELQTGQVIYAPQSDIAPYAIPDDKIHSVLLAHGVDGLRQVTPVHGTSRGSELSYSGNLIDPTWMSICVSGSCNSRCKFCYTEWIRHKPGLPSTMIRKALEHASLIPSLNTVVFSGGEPTLRRDLCDLIEYAKAQGIVNIGLQSNGHRLADKDYVEKLRRAGLSGVLLSLHGSTSATHDSMVGLNGSFDTVLHAVAALEELEIRTTLNYVVCSTNSSELPEFVSLVTSLSDEVRIRFSFPIIEGEAFHNVTDILPSLPSFIDTILAAVEENPCVESRVEIANVPPCISDQLRMSPTYLVSQRMSLLEISPFYEHDIFRGEQLVKLQACVTCTWFENCGGIQVPYLTRFRDAQTHFHPNVRTR